MRQDNIVHTEKRYTMNHIRTKCTKVKHEHMGNSIIQAFLKETDASQLLSMNAQRGYARQVSSSQPLDTGAMKAAGVIQWTCTSLLKYQQSDGPSCKKYIITERRRQSTTACKISRAPCRHAQLAMLQDYAATCAPLVAACCEKLRVKSKHCQYCIKVQCTH